MSLNKLIEKVLYIPPDCKYESNDFTYPCSYTEMWIPLSLVVMTRSDHNGVKIPILHVKPLFSPDFIIVYSHANAEVIVQLYNHYTTV